MKTIEELREAAKKMYPPGTKFKPVNASDSDLIIIVRKTWKIESHNDDAIWFNTRDDNYAHTGYIYNKGRWAEIIHDGQPLLELAKKLYPVGTQYKCAAGGTTIYTVREQSFEYIEHADQVYGEPLKGCLYDKGKWAKIINVAATDSILEKLQSIFSPGVEFIPVYREGKLYDTSFTVKEDWKIIKSYGGYSFINKEGTYVHNQYLYVDGHWAQVTASIEELPERGYVSMLDNEHYDVLSILKTTRKRAGEAHFDHNYLIWNTDEYWFVTEKPNRHYKEVNQSINPINNSENEKHTSTESRAAILQSSNLKIGQGSSCRGVGLKGSISKIRLGNHGSNYQERLSYS